MTESYQSPLWLTDATKARLALLPFSPRTVLDIGAFEGYWSKGIKEVFPDCRPFLIEADTQKEPQLEATGFSYSIALLADRQKSVSFYKSKLTYTTGNSIYRENSTYFTDPNCYYTEQCQTRTLAQVVAEHHLQAIDLIKLDVQGAEKDVLLGGVEVVREAKFLVIELSLVEYNQGAPLYLELVQLLDQLGFDLWDIIELHYNRQTHRLEQFDCIFCNRQI